MNYAPTSYFNDCFSWDDEVKEYIKSWSARNIHGTERVIELPFYDEYTDFSIVLSNWKDRLESLASDLPKGLLDFEYDLAAKVGPMSTVTPLIERMDDIRSYYESISLPQVPIEEEAVKRVISKWNQARGMQIRSQARTIENMKLSTFSGSPYCAKRRDVVGNTVPCGVGWNPDGTVWQYVTQEDGAPVQFGACAMLGHRGQEGGPTVDDVKHRIIFMFPLAVNICELQLYQVLIANAQRFGIQPAWISNDAVDREMTLMFDTKASNDLVICTDFSKFDQHFNRTMQDGAARILRGLFAPNKDFEAWMERVFPIKFKIPLAICEGKVLTGDHGMGSGAGGTSPDETITHNALQYEVALKHDSELNPHSQDAGDDGCLTYKGIKVEHVVESYESHGQVCNPEKQYASSDSAVYLRRFYSTDYRPDGIMRGIYSTCRALGRLRYMERWINGWSKEAQIFRAFSILNNLKWHPLKEEFADFVLKGDKFKLGLSIPGFFDNIDQSYQSALLKTGGRILTWNTENMSEKEPLSQWWIVKYLESKL